MPDFSAEHDAPADAGAQRDHRHIRHATGGAQPLLAERGHVGVVFEDNARFIFEERAGAQAALDFRAHRIVLPSGEVG